MCNQKPTALYLYLQIKDINNNAPEFINSPYEYNVSEFTQVGTTINPYPIIMYDKDYPRGDNIVMDVEAKMDGENTFRISYTSEEYSRKQNLSIILNEKLDYSKKATYNFVLVVKDRGIPQLSSNTTVTVNVIDEDNQDPVFENFLCYTEIIVNQTKDVIILKSKEDDKGIRSDNLNKENADGEFPLVIQPPILAYDQDFGINDTVNYALGTNDYTDYFKVDEHDGHVSLKKFEKMMVKNYSIVLPLEAYQTNNERRKAKATLIVKVRVVSPLQPHFSHQIYIPKNLLIGDPIYQVNILQDDITYEIRENSYISINETSGSLSLSKNASQLPTSFKSDIEAKTSVDSINNEFQGNFTVIERDSWKTPLFNKSSYVIEIPKTSKKNDHLFKIEVNDPNAELNLLGRDSKYFAIEKDINWIILKDDLVSEKVNYSIIIEATSKAGNLIMERDSCKVLFQVSEADFHPRIFKKDVYLVDMLPQWAVNSSIFTIQLDVPEVIFNLTGEYADYFYVDNITRNIHLIEQINICQKYIKLLLLGQVKVPPFHKDKTEIILQAVDPNCKSRLFQTDIYLLDMLPDWKEEKSILKLTSLLPNVTFSLGKDVVKFTVNSTTGEIFFVGQINICRRHNFTVFGTPANPSYDNGTALVILQVKDWRCNAKIFEKDSYVIYISSEWKEDDSILNLTTSMPVEQFYLLGEDSVHFNISSNGKLYLVVQPDICKDYKFQVFAKANDPVLRNETTQITLISKYANCHTEIFGNDLFLIDISSEWKIGENVFNITSPFPKVTFTLGDKSEYFEINNATGQVFLTEQLDICKKYQLSVHGETEGPPHRKGVTKLVFMSEVCIKKSRGFSKCVYAVTKKNIETEEKFLVDLRENTESSDVKFEISEGNENGLFKIEEGKLLLARQPTDEGQYRLKVLQRTDEKLSRSIKRNEKMEVSNNEALVIVNIGERKSQVMFLHPRNWFKLFLPTAPLNDYWFTVKATSLEELSSIKFSIKSDDFEVDSSSGLVSPKVDVTMSDGYNTSFAILAATNNNRAEMNIYIYRLKYNNAVKVMLKTNTSASMINLKNTERTMSKILQCDVHILQYKRTPDSKHYELIVGAIKDEKLLEIEELKDRVKTKTTALEDVFGNFEFAPYTAKIVKKESGVDLLIPTILLACITSVLCILILLFVIRSKLRTRKNCHMSDELLKHEKSNNIDVHMSEHKESFSEKETAPLSNDVNQVEVAIDSEMAQPEASVVPPDKVEENNQHESSTKDTLYEPVLQDYQKNDNSEQNEKNECENEEAKSDINELVIEKIYPDLNDCTDETSQENNLISNDEAENHAYCNEAFEDTSVNLNKENKMNCTAYNDSTNYQVNELEKATDNDASPNNTEKKVSVKFNDVATLIP